MTNKSHTKGHKGRFEDPTDMAVKITFSWNTKSCTYSRFERWRWPHEFPSKFRYLYKKLNVISQRKNSSLHKTKVLFLQ